jgi:hypothetical protein
MPVYDPDNPNQGTHMRVTPRTDSDLKREQLFEPGEYDFEIESAEDRVSKTGNEMVAIKMKVFAGERRAYVRDWLLDKMAHKLKHFCYSVGMGEKYEAGGINAADCQGRAGRVYIVIEDNPDFGPQNRVKDYVVPTGTKEVVKAVKPMPSAAAAAASHDDSIPF